MILAILVVASSIQAATAPSFVTATATVGNASSFSFGHTPGSASNQLLIVSVGVRGAVSATAVTFGGVALTSLTKNAQAAILISQVWYILNPVTYNANVVVTMESSIRTVIGAQTYSDVDQTTPFGASALQVNDSVGSLMAVTVTTTAANSLIFSHAVIRGLNVLTSNQNIRYNEATSGGAASANATAGGDDSSAPTVGSYGIFWAQVGTQTSLMRANEIIAFVAGPTPTPTPEGPPAGSSSMMGVGR